jgi:hypothetical protein
MTLFLVCIAVRALLAYLAATVPLQWLKVMAIPAFFIALGFTIIFLGGYRKTGIETGGRKIWWNSLRPVHATFYLLFAYFAWTGNREVAWKLLAADVLVGVSAKMMRSRNPRGDA